LSQTDSAAGLARLVRRELVGVPQWNYRLAEIALASHEIPAAYQFALPLAVLSRQQDAEVVALLSQISEAMGAGRRVEEQIRREIALRDQRESEAIANMESRRVEGTADDGFPLGGVLFADPMVSRRKAILVVRAPEDTVTLYDSLGVGLRRAGYAVLVLDPRGTGRSVSPAVALPETWRGREAALESRCASDVRSALQILAREAKADTSRYVVVGVGSTAPIAVEAGRSPRVPAIVLVSPTVAPDARGQMRATIAARHLPVFIQVAPEDQIRRDQTELFYRASDMPRSRVTDLHVPGTGMRIFHTSPGATARLATWLKENWPAPRARPATRPASRRKG